MHKKCAELLCFQFTRIKTKIMLDENSMIKPLTQKKIATYTSRLLKGYNSIMAHDDISCHSDFRLTAH